MCIVTHETLMKKIREIPAHEINEDDFVDITELSQSEKILFKVLVTI